MKTKLLALCLCLMAAVSLSSCHYITNREIYAVTDDYVENLYKYSGRGGIMGLKGDEKKTEDGKVTVCAVGKLIIVKLEYVAKDGEYEALRDHLKDRYKDNSRVRDVYINKGGTVVIDCRN